MLQMLNYTSLYLLCIHLLQCIFLCFLACKGIKNIKKQKMENPCQIPEYYKNLEKPKKTKKGEPMYIQNLEKPKKQKGQNLCKTRKRKKPKWQNLCPSVWHGVNTFDFFFIFFWFFQIKPKESKWQNLYASVWYGVNTFVFFSGNTKKNKMAESMSQCLAWDQYFFLFFFLEKPKNKKNKMAEPMSQCLAWGQYFYFFWFFQIKQKKSKW